MKKEWFKPQLIVLHRDNAEAVLALCKLASGPSGPTTQNSGCWALPCSKCNAQTGS
jgi:hypothetical protein